MIDGLLTNKLVQDLKEKLLGGRIQKIYQLNDFEVLFKVRSNRTSYQLINSIHSNAFRLHITNNTYSTFENATNFTMVLRKQLEGGVITNITQQDCDRVVIFEIKKLNELRDEQSKYLIFELLGRHANTILTDHDYKIIQTLKFIPLSIASNRLMQKNTKYEFLSSDKNNPLDNIENTDNYLEKYQGFSSQLNKEFLKENQSNIDAQDILKKYLNSNQYYVYPDTISAIQLQSSNKEFKVFNDINEAFDYQYAKESNEKAVAKEYNVEIKNIKSIIKKNNRKIDKLNKDYEKNKESDYLRDKAILIYDNLYQFDKNKHYHNIKVFDYTNNEEVSIDLDYDKSLSHNANVLMNQYNKAKKSLEFIEKEIAKACKENTILENALDHLSYANIYDAREIITELVTKKYLHLKNYKVKKTKKNIPMYETYITPDNTTIYVGKNNIQNDYITFTLASRFDTWLHIKNLPGSHVIIHKEEPTNDDLEWGARLALHFSKAEKDLKYEVDYTLVKNLKKKKGSMLGQVIFHTNESIYIDNDPSKIAQLKRG